MSVNFGRGRAVWPTLALAAAILSLAPALPAVAQAAPTVTLRESNHVVAVGQSVAFVAQAVDVVGTPEYQFWVELPSGVWVDAQNYSPANRFTLTATRPGNYLVAVDVLNAAQVAAGAWSAAASAVPVALFANSTLTLTPPSGPLLKGNTATLTAAAVNIAHPLYQFWIEQPNGSWSQSGPYQPSPTDTFALAMAGTYRAVAYAKSPDAPADGVGALASAVATWTVAAGPGSSVEYLGGAISPQNPVILTANQPVALQIVNVDAGGNPVPILGTAAGIFRLPSLAGLAGAANWEPVGGGAPITTVTIAPTASSATVWLVSNTTQTLTSLPPAVRELVLTAQRPNISANVVDTVSIAGIPGGGGVHAATITGLGKFAGTITSGAKSATINNQERQVIEVAVSSSGTASFAIQGTLTTATTLTVTIEGISGTLSLSPATP